MKTIEIPEGVRFADTQSEMNFERVASGGMPSGLLVIEGEKATGKSRLAKHLVELLGEKLRVMYLPNEKSLEYIFNVEKPRLAFFDEVRTSKVTPKNRVSRKPLDSPAIVGAVEGGVLVILVGLEVDLAPDLERRAVRVRLGQNVKEHATLSARASFDHGVEVECRKWHVNRAADRGCVSRLVRFHVRCIG